MVYYYYLKCNTTRKMVGSDKPIQQRSVSACGHGRAYVRVCVLYVSETIGSTVSATYRGKRLLTTSIVVLVAMSTLIVFFLLFPAWGEIYSRLIHTDNIIYIVDVGRRSAYVTDVVTHNVEPPRSTSWSYIVYAMAPMLCRIELLYNTK